MRQHGLALLCATLLLASLVAVVTAAPFKCDSGSRFLDESQIDDDYCDCADGTDEVRADARRAWIFFGFFFLLLLLLLPPPLGCV